MLVAAAVAQVNEAMIFSPQMISFVDVHVPGILGSKKKVWYQEHQNSEY